MPNGQPIVVRVCDSCTTDILSVEHWQQRTGCPLYGVPPHMGGLKSCGETQSIKFHAEWAADCYSRLRFPYDGHPVGRALAATDRMSVVRWKLDELEVHRAAEK